MSTQSKFKAIPQCKLRYFLRYFYDDNVFIKNNLFYVKRFFGGWTILCTGMKSIDLIGELPFWRTSMKYFLLNIIVFICFNPTVCFSQNNGIVRFGGSFIEEACNIYSESSELTFKCFSHNKWKKNTLSAESIPSSTSNELYSTTYKKLNNNKNLAVLTVNYS